MAGGFHIPHAITRNTLAGSVDTRNVSYTEYPMQSEDEATPLAQSSRSVYWNEMVCTKSKCSYWCKEMEDIHL
jgi:hypothetical protein